MIAKFIVGNTYTARNICDHKCVFRYNVVKRTAKHLYLQSSWDVFKRGIYIYEGVEHCKPKGTYPMCPVISADKGEGWDV